MDQILNFIKLRRGRVIVPFNGEIDFSRDNISVEICKELYEKGFPYLELTELGQSELYGIIAETPLSKQEHTPKKKKI